MNARPLVLSVAALCVLSAACGDTSRPKIKSFEASSTNVPIGREVTLTWDVKGEDSLELLPFPGAVTGTGITLTLPESTEFTLHAKGNGRSDRASVYVGHGD